MGDIEAGRDATCSYHSKQFATDTQGVRDKYVGHRMKELGLGCVISLGAITYQCHQLLSASQLITPDYSGGLAESLRPNKRRQRLSLEATQGQIDGFFSQLPHKFHLGEVASVGY